MKYPNSKDNAIRTSIGDFPLPKRLKLRGGKLLARLFPRRAAKIDRNPFDQALGRLDRLIRNGLYARAFETGDFRRLRHFLSHYWTTEARRFHQGWSHRFEEMFLKHDVEVIAHLEELMDGDAKGVRFSCLYEIGCGGGQVLDYLRQRLKKIPSFVGIDIGEDQIASNEETYDDPSISFRAADAVKWLPQNASQNCIMLTNGGVLEYFLKEEVELIFSHVATLAPAAIALIETIGSNHDLENQPSSYVYARELAFSHNYPELLRNAGFEILHQSERAGNVSDGGGRWVRILAWKPNP